MEIIQFTQQELVSIYNLFVQVSAKTYTDARIKANILEKIITGLASNELQRMEGDDAR